MVGLGKHVKEVQVFECVAGLGEALKVAGEGGGVAADVTDILWQKCDERVEGSGM